MFLRRREFWTRFLLSVLADADRLDTERFLDREKAQLRGKRFDSIRELRRRLDAWVDAMVASLPAAEKESPVNRRRQEILDRCRRAALEPPGVFSLTVPTGGGKTLSAMSFALRHAEQHGLRRVFVVIPYTSIIEQNAELYCRALGKENVLEHHSNLDVERRRRTLGDEPADRHDLAAENWRMPVVVTTTVQFFETLFTNKTSRVRKLHNVARSVIVLDEVQTLPPGLLLPILDALRELTEHYGCSVLLSTATPPALAQRPTLPDGLKSIRPIIPDPRSLAQALARVRFEGLDTSGTVRTWEELAREVAGQSQALVIVHRRDDARTLARLLMERAADAPVYHLSALMCPRHRLAVIKTVRRRLARGLPCLLVSTQLVEAGVDLDFPVVYRSLAGLDSLVQAAGRCNREGRLGPRGGRVVIFRAESKPPAGTLRQALAVTEQLFAAHPGESLDPSAPDLCEEFFRMLYGVCERDEKRIQRDREEFQFATVAGKFQMIEEAGTATIVAPYGPRHTARVFRVLERLRKEGPDRELFRGLQPYLVTVYRQTLERLRADGRLAEPITYWAGKEQRTIDGLHTLHDLAHHVYDPVFGLWAETEAQPDAGCGIV